MANYTPVNWKDDVPVGTGTPLDAAHFNQMDNGIAGALPRDSAFSAAQAPYQNRLAAGDPYGVFAWMGDGKLLWGPGGAYPSDTNLYRSQAGVLKTDGQFVIGKELFTGAASGFGTIFFGAAQDTNLYCPSPALLKTDGQFGVGGPVYVDMTGAGNKLYFGSAQDTNLYRLQGGILKTDGQFRTANEILGPIGPSNESGIRMGGDTNLYRATEGGALRTDGHFRVRKQITVDEDGVGYNLYFGNAWDTNLYRLQGGNLKTDGSLHAAGNFIASSVPGGGGGHVFIRNDAARVYFGVGDDTSLYRAFGGALATNGLFSAYYGTVNQSMLSYNASGQPGLFFGNPIDANLYRDGAGSLKTDGLFAAGTLRAGSGANTIDIYNDGHIYWGSPSDTSIYRSAYNQLTIPSDAWLIFDNGTQGASGLVLNFSVNIGNRRLWCGAPDSGGAGYRMVRVPN